MRKKIILSVSIVILSISISIAQNFTAFYSFDSVTTTSGLIDPTIVPNETGLVFGSFSATGTPVNPSSSTRFSFKDWPTGSVDGDSLYSQLTGSVNFSEYYEVTLTPDAGYSLDLSSITFGVVRSSTGIRTYVVRSSSDGYVSNLPASINPVNAKLSVQSGDVFFWNSDATTTNQNSSTITLGGANFTNLLGPITFRFYGYNAEGSVGTFGIDNVTFTGTANAITTYISDVPESTDINIYPNPSVDGVFTISSATIDEKIIVVVYNILGKIILRKEITPGSKNKIDLSNEKNGIYLMAFENAKASSIQKIVINK